ncbi:MAG TPA: type IV pilus twitching motility protein PilT [Gaiellaceae bacterium]
MAAFTLIDLFEQMAAAGASDLHLCAGSPPVLRVRGELERLDIPPLTAEEMRDLVYRITTLDQQKELEVERELDFSYGLGNKWRFRLNAFYDRDSVACAVRLVPATIPTLEDIRMPMIVRELAFRPRGLVLVTGPTGSGKSTTLAAMVDAINEERACHIVTVEDPIEFMHSHKRAVVNQREVGADTRSFARALRSALRQDPDVILVGELRDLDSISIALTAAETGHLVFATLHTRSAAGAIDRIVDVFPHEQQAQVRVQLGASLQGIIAQALLVTADGEDRRAAVEVLVADDAVRNLIRQAKMEQVHSYMHTGGRRGMHTLEQALAKLVQDGDVAVAEALAHANDPEQLRRLVARGNDTEAKVPVAPVG